MLIGTGQSPGRPEFCERLGILPGVVGGDPDRLAHDAQSPGERSGRLGVRKGKRGVFIDEDACGHQVTGDEVGRVAVEGAQAPPYLTGRVRPQ